MTVEPPHLGQPGGLPGWVGTPGIRPPGRPQPPAGVATRVVDSWPLTPTTHAIRVERPEPFSYAPTQFTFMLIRTGQGMAARPMSLATSPTRPHLEYAVRLTESPFKQAFAALRPGDQVGISGPIGDFVLDAQRPAVMIAGGIGVTPLKGMAEYAADRQLPIPIRLIFSNRDESDIVYRDELDQLERRNPRFQVFVTLTRAADPSWTGATGRVGPQLVRQAAADLEDPLFYLSGTPGMVAGLCRLLRENYIPAHAVRAEAFRGYHR